MSHELGPLSSLIEQYTLQESRWAEEATSLNAKRAQLQDVVSELRAVEREILQARSARVGALDE